MVDVAQFGTVQARTAHPRYLREPVVRRERTVEEGRRLRVCVRAVLALHWLLLMSWYDLHQFRVARVMSPEFRQ